MNYLKIYDSLIKNAKLQNRKKHQGIYYENHHIVPRSLGGSDSKENLVLLTAKEHFISHKLLLFISPNNESIIRAFHMMCHFQNGNYDISSKDYRYSRELLSEILRKREPWNKGKTGIFSKESLNKIRKTWKNKKHTEETKEKMRNSKLGERNPIFGKDSPNKGKIQPCSEKQKIKLSIAAKKIPKIECKYCHKLTSPGNYSKWHGEKCKLNIKI
jgi:hypothetical protein